MVRALGDIQNIADKAYLVLSNRGRIAANDRKIFYLESRGIQHGSLSATLGIVVAGVQPMLPIISDLGPTGIWERTKEAFNLLKLVFSSKKAGMDVKISEVSGGMVNVNTGTQNITFSGPVLQIAKNALPHYEDLARLLEPQNINTIRLGRDGRADIELKENDRLLFDLPHEVQEDVRTLECEIYEFDKYEKQGRINVRAGQQIEKGEYKFNVVGGQESSEYIEAMLHRQVRVICHEEIVDHPLLGRKIARLQVIKVAVVE
ncbi:hypothetical protein CJO92_00700 [Ralstonia solanacearum]|nr:hypothetical protein CJO92_00700 [Ralstonia solanacearum]